MLINTVAFRPPGPWTKDAAGGRVLNPGPELVTFPASVQPSAENDVPEHMRETGVVYWTILVHQDPSPLKPRDQVILIDMGNALATITGITNSAGRSSTWRIIAEQRLPQ